MTRDRKSNPSPSTDAAETEEQKRPPPGVKKSPIMLTISAVLFSGWTIWLAWLAIRLGQ